MADPNNIWKDEIPAHVRIYASTLVDKILGKNAADITKDDFTPSELNILGSMVGKAYNRHKVDNPGIKQFAFGYDDYNFLDPQDEIPFKYTLGRFNVTMNNDNSYHLTDTYDFNKFPDGNLSLTKAAQLSLKNRSLGYIGEAVGERLLPQGNSSARNVSIDLPPSSPISSPFALEKPQTSGSTFKEYLTKLLQ